VSLSPPSPAEMQATPVHPCGLPLDHLPTAVENIDAALISIDSAKQVIGFNRRAEEVFGYTREEVLGSGLDRLVSDREWPAHASRIDEVLSPSSGSPRSCATLDFCGLRKCGGGFHAEARVTAMDDGVQSSALLVLRDLGGGKRAAGRLAQRERQLAEIQRISRSGSWEWDIEANRVTWSDELFRLYGLEPGSVELTLDTFLERLVPEDRENTRARIQEAVEHGDSFDFDERIVRPDGTIRVLRSVGEVIRNGDGRPERLIGICRDVTEEREAAERASEHEADRAARKAAEASERRMRFLAEASAELGSSLDYEGTLRTVARLAVPTMGDWCAVDLVDDRGEIRRVAVEHTDLAKIALAQELHERYPPDPDDDYGVAAVIRSGRSECVAEIPDGFLETVAVDEEHLRMIRSLGLRSYIVAPLTTREGTLGAMTFVCAESGEAYTEEHVRVAEDLARRAASAIENARLHRAVQEAHARIEEQASEVELQAEELATQALRAKAARDEAERANQAKSRFLTVMSHELRTPLNAIIGYADLMSAEVSGPLNDPQRIQIERIGASGQHLLGLINQVLNLARIEAGREEVRLEVVDLDDLLRETASMIEPLAERDGLRVVLDFPEDSLRVETDPGKLRQILLNLLGNAVKFTDAGQVELSLRAEEDRVLIEVRDTGIGMDESHLERIFDPFEQVEQEGARQSGGTGLGLPVSRMLARMLGGEVTVVSGVGQGSTFTLRLPR